MNRQQRGAGQLVISRAKVTEATANVAQARAAVESAEEDLANATIKAPIRAHRADARRRDRQPGVVDPQPRRERHARLHARRHRTRVRARQGGRSRHRPRASRSARAASPPRRSATAMFQGRVTQISPIGVEKDNVTTFEVEGLDRQPGQGAEGQHDRQRRDHPRGVRRTRCSCRKRRSSTTRSTTPSSICSIASAPDRPHARARARSASATARRCRSCAASRPATRSSCRTRRCVEIFRAGRRRTCAPTSCAAS